MNEFSRPKLNRAGAVRSKASSTGPSHSMSGAASGFRQTKRRPRQTATEMGNSESSLFGKSGASPKSGAWSSAPSER